MPSERSFGLLTRHCAPSVSYVSSHFIAECLKLESLCPWGKYGLYGLCILQDKLHSLKLMVRPCVTPLTFFPPLCSLHVASAVLSKPCAVTVANEPSKKKVDVIDLTVESSSDEEEGPPAKRKCIFMSETQSSPTKGFVNL